MSIPLLLKRLFTVGTSEVLMLCAVRGMVILSMQPLSSCKFFAVDKEFMMSGLVQAVMVKAKVTVI